jgi:hypothetical protein
MPPTVNPKLARGILGAITLRCTRRARERTKPLGMVVLAAKSTSGDGLGLHVLCKPG